MLQESKMQANLFNAILQSRKRYLTVKHSSVAMETDSRRDVPASEIDGVDKDFIDEIHLRVIFGADAPVNVPHKLITQSLAL